MDNIANWTTSDSPLVRWDSHWIDLCLLLSKNLNSYVRIKFSWKGWRIRFLWIWFYQDWGFQHARLNVKYILFLIAIVFTEECSDELLDCELENVDPNQGPWSGFISTLRIAAAKSWKRQIFDILMISGADRGDIVTGDTSPGSSPDHWGNSQQTVRQLTCRECRSSSMENSLSLKSESFRVSRSKRRQLCLVSSSSPGPSLFSSGWSGPCMSLKMVEFW